MYCKHCGKEIDDNSTFCKHCGKSQGNTQKGIVSKPVWIIYFIWVLANLYLLIGKKLFKASSYFFPFTAHEDDFDDYVYCNWDNRFYDFSEFIVYVFILPAILFVVYRRYSEKIDKFVDKLLNKK